MKYYGIAFNFVGRELKMRMKQLFLRMKEYFKTPNDIIIAITDVRATGIRYKEGTFFDEAITRENSSFEKIVLSDRKQTDYKSLVKKMFKAAARRFFRSRVFMVLHPNTTEPQFQKYNDIALLLNPKEIYLFDSALISIFSGMNVAEVGKNFREYEKGIFIYSDYSSTIFGIHFIGSANLSEVIPKKLSYIDKETFDLEIKKVLGYEYDNFAKNFDGLSEVEREDILFAWSKPLSDTISIVSPTMLSFQVSEYKINYGEDYPNIIIKSCEKYIERLDYFAKKRKKEIDDIDNFFVRVYERNKQSDHQKVLKNSAWSFFFLMIFLQLGSALNFSFVYFVFSDEYKYEFFLQAPTWVKIYITIFGLGYLIILKMVFFMQIDIFVLVFKRIQIFLQKK
jgi:hypothetical protein